MKEENISWTMVMQAIVRNVRKYDIVNFECLTLGHDHNADKDLLNSEILCAISL